MSTGFDELKELITRINTKKPSVTPDSENEDTPLKSEPENESIDDRFTRLEETINKLQINNPNARAYIIPLNFSNLK